MRFYSLSQILTLCFALSLLSGCSKEEPFDLPTVTDQQIDEGFLEMYEQNDLDNFMKQGGRIVDIDPSAEVKIDKSHILPLLKEMEEKYGFKWIVLTDPSLKKDAMQIISRIPPGTSPKAVNAYLLENLDTFPGEILQGWGNVWFSIEFLGPEEAEMLRELEAEIPE
ncbi:hypothetical protein [Thalassoglobus sp.]|uniref:hypothetical protein n=1 Tax=Thalassoglobus sp. TaxID=2795869 RepID=UPI003AA895D1